MIEIAGQVYAFDDPLVIAAAAGAAFALLILILLIAALRAAGRSARAVEPLSRELGGIAARVDRFGEAQQRLTGGLTHVAEAQAVAQTQMLATMERRLEEVTRSMGDSLHGTATRTARSLGDLQQRLETIDKAQANIEKLSGNVLGLQDILSNKQTRGAFGEIQLMDIVRKAMPPDAFTFQATLSNGRRADALIHLPMPPGPIVIDSKFPLEAYEALRRADGDAALRAAASAMRTAVRAHVKAISERYIIEGETADGALLFLPSEAVYAELHANFGELVREGFTARVWIVSPTTCMATLNTLRSVLKDVQMREQAGKIRRELGLLHGDVSRLGDRVANLDRHFGQAQKDLGEIRTSAEKAGRRAQRLENFDFAEVEPSADPAIPTPNLAELPGA